ncbi:unnamed protein product [Linum tenue]|uniref:Syringolide-induced protein 14-1-1 n=2 Tax=Linum tenue TaxID=586396 RepID=A0AAV0HBT4_9ROSI|nr:unnamed protein product [Linum tenue]
MEKQSKAKNSNHHNVIKFLKAASSINFNNPPFSPTRDHQPFSDHKVPNYQGNYRGFSGPIFLPRVPREVRGRFKSGEAAEEPTSPKISCIGQIKHKKCGGKKTTGVIPKPAAKEKKQSKKSAAAKEQKNPKPQQAGSPGIWKIFGSGSFKLGPSSAPGRKRRSNSSSAADNLFVSDELGEESGQPLTDRAPCLSQMRRFASGHRDGFGDFDWTARIAPDHDQFGREYDSDGDEGGYSDDEMGAEETMIPFSAPIRVVSAADVEGMRLRPRKEVNLWKRRTMEPPRPLQLVGSGSIH